MGQATRSAAELGFVGLLSCAPHEALAVARVEDALPDPKLRARIVGPGLLPEGEGPAGEGDLHSPTNSSGVSGLAEEILSPPRDQAQEPPGRLSLEDVV